MGRTISNILHDFSEAYRKGKIQPFLDLVSTEEAKEILNNCVYFSFASLRDLINNIIDRNKYLNKKNKEKLKYFDPDEFMGITRKTTKDGLKINYSKLASFSICKRKEIDPIKVVSSENIMYNNETLPQSIGKVNRMSNGRIFLCGTPNNGKYLCTGSDVLFEGYHPILLSKKISNEEYSRLPEEYFQKLLKRQDDNLELKEDSLKTDNELFREHNILDFQEFMKRFSDSSAHNQIMDKGKFYIIPEFNQSAPILIDKHWLKAMLESLCDVQDKMLNNEDLEEGRLSPSLNLQIIGNFGSLTAFASNNDKMYIKAKSDILVKIMNELEEKKSLIIDRKKKSPKLNVIELIKNKVITYLEPYQQEYDSLKPMFANNFLANDPVSINHITPTNQIETILALQSAHSTMNQLYENIVLAFRKKCLTQSGYKYLQQLSESKVFDPLLKHATRFNKQTNLIHPKETIYRGMIKDNINLISIIRNAICHAKYFIEYDPSERDCKITFYRTDAYDAEIDTVFKLLAIESVSITSRKLLRILNDPIFKYIPYSFIDKNRSNIEYGKSKINYFSNVINGEHMAFSSRNLYEEKIKDKNYLIDKTLDERCEYLDTSKIYSLNED